MPLTTGQTLSFYEILAPLGAGGMGEVYRAKDTRLEREVAIKVLPEELAGDEERLRRFEREAKTLASLNHANVAGIHGVDQVDDVCFLALELVPGEDLATRLERGALPLDEAIDVCRQIAEGLEAAHEAGVVHRDLKPANVRVTPEGKVKVLDFGLAKPMQPGTSKDGTSTAQPDSFLLTEEGMVLGTPTYMSPEQARGRPVDKRTDVWAFGCVLFECLAGRRVFQGESFGDVLASVIGNEPDWSALPRLPRRVSELLRRTLTKDPQTRLRDIGEARIALELARGEPVGEEVAGAGSGSGASRVAWIAALLSLLALVVGFLAGRGTSGGASLSAGGADVERPALHALLHEFEPDRRGLSEVSLSPDGLHLTWVDEGIWIRSLGEMEPRQIHEGEVAELCWSPDGRELAFLENGWIWRLSVDGGRPERVEGTQFEERSDLGYLRWLADGRFLCGGSTSAWTIPAGGGERVTLAEVTGGLPWAHWHFIHPLPDGSGAVGALHDFAGSMNTVEVFRDGGSEVVFEDPGADFKTMLLTPDGMLLYACEHEDGDGIWTVPLSLEDLAVTGEPRLQIKGGWEPSLSDDGMLGYVLEERSGESQMAWLDLETGELDPVGKPNEELRGVGLSPDRRKILFSVRPATRMEFWIHDLDRGVAAPFVQREGFMARSLWLPDGRIAVSSFGEPRGTYAYTQLGRSEPEKLSDHMLQTACPDGEHYVFTTIEPNFRDSKTFIVGPGPDGEELPYLRSEDNERIETFSRDGKWMLYRSSRAGMRQIYLSRFPPGDESWSLGVEEFGSMWFRDDLSEILYVQGGGDESNETIFRISLTTTPEVRLGAPEPVRELESGFSLEDYDGAGRFLVVTSESSTVKRVYVDTGWAERE